MNYLHFNIPRAARAPANASRVTGWKSAPLFAIWRSMGGMASVKRDEVGTARLWARVEAAFSRLLDAGAVGKVVVPILKLSHYPRARTPVVSPMASQEVGT